MKKVILFFLAAVMACGLVGCGDPKPESKYTEDTADAMEVVIDIADKVLADELPAETVVADLEKIVDSMDISYIEGREARNLVGNVLMCIKGYESYTTGISADSPDAEEMAKESFEMIELTRNRLYDALYGN